MTVKWTWLLNPPTLITSCFIVIMEALFDTSILSWNVRGDNNNNVKRHMK
jgi:hypothetical protein